MKALFILLLALVPLVASAQDSSAGYGALPKDSVSQKITYQGIEQVAGAGKEELFARAEEWGARNFADSKFAEKVSNKEAGSIIYRCAIPGRSSMYKCVVALYIKDGRYKYLINDFTDKAYTPVESLETPAERWANYSTRSWAVNRSNELNKKVLALVANLKAAMSAKSPGAGF